MKTCYHCKQEIDERSEFCNFCGAAQYAQQPPPPTYQNPHYGGHGQQPRRVGSFLMTICIITIVGSALTFFRGMFYQAVSDLAHNSDYIRGILYAITSIGTGVAAGLMLNRKMVGLYIYTVCQVIYLFAVVWAITVYGNSSGFNIVIGALFFLPSLAFLIMYWTKAARDEMTK